MSDEQLTAEVLALPLCDRISLAEALWESIEADQTEANENKARKAAQRHQPLSHEPGGVPSIHEAIQAARRITGCS